MFATGPKLLAAIVNFIVTLCVHYSKVPFLFLKFLSLMDGSFYRGSIFAGAAVGAMSAWGDSSDVLGVRCLLRLTARGGNHSVSCGHC